MRDEFLCLANWIAFLIFGVFQPYFTFCLLFNSFLIDNFTLVGGIRFCSWMVLTVFRCILWSFFILLLLLFHSFFKLFSCTIYLSIHLGLCIFCLVSLGELLDIFVGSVFPWAMSLAHFGLNPLLFLQISGCVI